MNTLLASARITRKSEAISVDRSDGTQVSYYIFPEFEIHTWTIKPHAKQGWHHHKKIEETLLITHGTVHVLWVGKADKINRDLLKEGDMIRVGASVHTLENQTNLPVSGMTFRFVPDGIDKHTLIKNDRYADNVSGGIK